MRFKTKTIGEVAEVQTGPFGSQLHKEDYVEAGTPIVTVEHLGQRRFSMQNLPRVKDCDRDRLLKYTLKTGDLVFSRVGSVDRISFVTDDENGWMFSGRCLRLRVFGEIDALWLYYFFCLEQTKQFVRNIAVGATMPSINTKLLSEVPVSYPENIADQRKIASILSLIDDKIELNSTINHNLEQQASALVGHYMQSIDTSVSIANIMSFDSGFPFQSSTYLPSGKYRIITIKNVQDGNIETSNTVFINNLPTRMKNNCILHVGDVLLSLTGNVGRVGIVCEENLLLNQRVAKIVPNDIGLLPLLYFIFRQPDIKLQMELIAKGTAQSNLSPVETLRLTIPFERKTAEALSRTLAPMYQTIISTTQESHSLSSLRDALLPKLMSGEIDVSEVEL